MRKILGQTTGYMAQTKFVPQFFKINFHLSDWIPMFAVISISLLLFVNLVRAVNNAGINFQVYEAEKVALTELQTENQKLKSELDYYSSYEYSELYARDTLKLAEPGQRLYRVVTDSPDYQVPVKKVDVFADKNYVKWWAVLF